MGVTLTQRVNELNIEYNEKPVFLTIRYGGSFVGQILGNTKSRLTRSEINIEFKEDIQETIMIYEGELIIYGIFAKNSNLEPIKGNRIKLVNDEIQRSKTKWDESTQKWGDYDKSLNKYYKPVMSIIEYKENDNIKFHEVRDKSLLSIPSRQNKILNRIRGNYGVK